jgi:hypothetical protein
MVRFVHFGANKRGKYWTPSLLAQNTNDHYGIHVNVSTIPNGQLDIDDRRNNTLFTCNSFLVSAVPHIFLQKKFVQKYAICSAHCAW